MKNGGILLFFNLQTRLIFKLGKQEREANKYTKRQNVHTDIETPMKAESASSSCDSYSVQCRISSCCRVDINRFAFQITIGLFFERNSIHKQSCVNLDLCFVLLRCWGVLSSLVRTFSFYFHPLAFQKKCLLFYLV